MQYAAHGAVLHMRLGNNWENWCFNRRLQPYYIGLGTTGVGVGTGQDCTVVPGTATDWNVLKLTYGYGASNNGNVWSQEINAAGNQTAAPGRAYSFDGETRMRTSSAVEGASNTRLKVRYDYDGEGRRVKTVACTGLTDAEACTETTVGVVITTFVYDAMGQLAAEYGGATDGLSGPGYLTADHLGSTRRVTDASGVTVKCYDYLPFGEELAQGVNGRGACYPTAIYPTTIADVPRQKFTGKERDGETGLDYFGAWYLSAAQGRFTSPDAPLVGQHPEDPQSWNLYSYGRNNPLSYVDPDGHDDVAAAGCGDDADCLKKLADARGKSAELLSGAAKSVVNGFIDLSNKINNVIDLAIGATGSSFQFGQTALLPMTSTEQAGGLLAAGVTLAATAGESALALSAGGTIDLAATVNNPVPETFARAIPGVIKPTTLGPAGATDVFVTAASDISGMNAGQLAQRLTIQPSSSFTVLEFPASGVTNIASPINRINPGFVGFGRTAGGAREFVVPNGGLPPGVKIRIVR